MQKFCRYCGFQFPYPGTKVCPQCGQMQEKPVPSANPPMLLLHVFGHPDQSIPLVHSQTWIGRDPACQVHIDLPFVSRQHARIDTREDSFHIVDNNSTNGLTINGKLASSAWLEHNTIIRIGDSSGNSASITFQLSRPDTPANSSAPRMMGSIPVSNSASITIGRDPACNIHLDHPAVSRRHAEMRPHTHGGHLLYDLGSANYTFVNGGRITYPIKLETDSIVQIGPYRLVYNGHSLLQFTNQGNYRIDAIGLTRDVTVGDLADRLSRRTTQIRILNNVSLSVEPREFVALVGGSGAGKSTLMKAMSGMAPAQGKLLINGEDLYSNFSAYRHVMGYVPQDDIIHHHLTVGSALHYAARLRLPDATPTEIENRIQRVLEDVELANHTETVVERLSGGQRKRVSIAAELLAEPGLFFLDEPTSGLDPGLEKKMMYNLRKLADGGRTIILVTHATANIDQCTHVAFLAKGGYLTYYGPPHEATGYFNSADFADIYTRLSEASTIKAADLSPEHRQQYHALTAQNKNQPPDPALFWASCFTRSAQYYKYVAQRQKNLPAPTPSPPRDVTSPARQRADFFQQFSVLSQRYLELIRRDFFSLIVLLAVMPVIGLLLLMMSSPNDLRGLPPGLSGGREDGCPRLLLPEDARTVREYIQCDLAHARRESRSGPYQGIYSVTGDAQRVLFVMALAPTLLGIFASAYEIVKEEPIYRRERLINLKLWPYLLSKTAVLSLFALLQSALFLFVITRKLILPETGVFLPATLEIYITLFLGTVASIGLGLFISAVVRSSGTVIYMILVILFVQILFAGAIFSVPASARPVTWVTITRWTLEGLGSTINMEKLRDLGGGCVEPDGLEDIPVSRRVPAAEKYCEAGQTWLPARYDFHINYHSTPGHLLQVWLTLMLFAAAFHFLTWNAQKRKDLI